MERVISVKPLDDFKIEVEFSDGPFFKIGNEAPRSPGYHRDLRYALTSWLRGIKAEFAIAYNPPTLPRTSAGRHTFHPCCPAESGTGYSGEGE